MQLIGDFICFQWVTEFASERGEKSESQIDAQGIEGALLKRDDFC